MRSGFFEHGLIEQGLGTIAQAGWGDVVESLKGAIEDPSHVNTLGIVLGVVLVVWVNYRIARWLMKGAGGGAGTGGGGDAGRSGPG